MPSRNRSAATVAKPGTPAAQSATAAALVNAERVLLIAHRGASRQAPENTLPAIAAAGAIGVDLVEIDYRHACDGSPFVIHDATVDRTTDFPQRGSCQDYPVYLMEPFELDELDAGAWFDPRFAGTRLPRLDDAIEAILSPGSGNALAVIERKDGDAQTLVGLLRRRGWIEKVVVIASDRRFLRGCRMKAPDLLFGVVREGPVTPKLVAECVTTGAKVAAWRYDDLTAEAIAQMHAAGLRVWAWTVDEAATARRLIRAGVDAIITNDPKRLARVVRADAGAAANRRRGAD